MSDQVKEMDCRIEDAAANGQRHDGELAGADAAQRVDKQLQSIAASVARIERKLDRILALSVESRRTR